LFGDYINLTKMSTYHKGEKITDYYKMEEELGK
jgi:hypothetical protein